MESGLPPRTPSFQQKIPSARKGGGIFHSPLARLRERGPAVTLPKSPACGTVSRHERR
ncbi:protein of unknown function [Magnetospirillum sp. XM-1]|nr:protein of unknown function [Magnetospirillum sp. XM-1]